MVPLKQIAAGFEAILLTSRKMEVITADAGGHRYTLFDDSYNSTAAILHQRARDIR